MLLQKQTIPSIVSNINAIFAIYLMSVWMFSYKALVIGYWGFIVTFILDVILNEKYKRMEWNNSKWLYIAMIAFCAIVPIWQLIINPDFTNPLFINDIEIHLPFLGIGIIGLFGFNDKIKLTHIGFAMIFVANLTVAYIIYKAGFSNLIEAQDIATYLNNVRLRYINSHMVVNMYFNTALLFSSYLITRKNLNWRKKALVLFLTLPIVSQLLISEGRVGFATTIVLLECAVIYAVWKFKPRIIWYTIPLVVACVIIILMQHPRVEHTMDDPRFELWNLGIETFTEKPMGHGSIDGRIEFSNSYHKRYSTEWFYRIYPGKEYRNKLHCHNVFIETAINYGIIGLLISISIYILPLIFSEQKRKPFIFCFLIIMFSECLFDVYGPLPTIPYALGIMLWLEGKWDK